MKLYLVQRVGVYTHETMGVYDNPQVAEERAAECALPPDDGHHSYYVSEIELNKPVEDAVALVSYRGKWEGNRYPAKDRKFIGVFKETSHV